MSQTVDITLTVNGEGVSARVVSLPCWESFELQSTDYRNDVLGIDL